MPPIATLYALLDPVGPLSIFASGLALLVALLGSERLFPHGWQWTIGITPALLPVVAGGVVILLPPLPEVESLSAFSVLIGVGFGAALASFRGQSWWHRVNAVLFTTSYGSLAVFCATNWISVFYPMIPPFGITCVFALLWLYVARTLYRKSAHMARAKRGLCHVCSYDLRGSTDAGRCPECGTRIMLPDNVQPIDPPTDTPTD